MLKIGDKIVYFTRFLFLCCCVCLLHVTLCQYSIILSHPIRIVGFVNLDLRVFVGNFLVGMGKSQKLLTLWFQFHNSVQHEVNEKWLRDVIHRNGCELAHRIVITHNLWDTNDDNRWTNTYIFICTHVKKMASKRYHRHLIDRSF